MSITANTEAGFPFSERYRLLDTIGRGATAIVWSAWDEHLKKIVALKLIQRGIKRLDSTSFEREARLVSTLEHPHIVPLYDYGLNNDTYYLSTRYLTGGTLAARLGKGPLAASEAVSTLGRIALALDYVHDQNVVHRDLKPGNILLDGQGMPYLGDFGLAKPVTAQDKEQSVSGTLNYMAPEQIVGRVSAASDVFAFGVMAWQVLTGILPFDGNQSLGMLMVTGMATLPSVQAVDPQLPRALNGFLRALTHDDPAMRPARLSPLIKELENILGVREQIALPSITPIKAPPKSTQSVLDDPYGIDTIFDEIEIAAQTKKSRDTTNPLRLTEFLIVDSYLQKNEPTLSPAAATIILETALHYTDKVAQAKWASYWRRLAGGLPLATRARLFGRLMVQELLRNAAESRSLLIYTVLGSVIAFAVQLYGVITPNPITDSTRMLNAVGNGLLFGSIIGVGLFAGAHLARRLRLISTVLAVGVGWLVSSLVIALAFGLFQKLFYLDTMEPGVALASAFVYSAGFVVAANAHPILQFVLSVAGVSAAYIVPFLLYLNEVLERPPFFFRYDDPDNGVPLAILCAGISAGVVCAPPLIRWYRQSVGEMFRIQQTTRHPL